MLTPDTLHEMTPEQRLETFEGLVTKVYGPDGVGERIAHDMGTTRQTYHGWKKNPGRIPFAVILLLQEWSVTRRRDAALLMSWGEVTEGMGAIATSLQRIAALSQGQSDELAKAQELLSEQSPTA